MDQPGIMAPQDFPVRHPTDRSQMNGRNANPPRYMEIGGFSGPGKWHTEPGDQQGPQEAIAKVKAATSVSAGRRGAKEPAVGQRLTGVNTVACEKLTPVGEAPFFPKYNVLVVGAGLGVDSAPAKEDSVIDLQARVQQLQAAKAAKEAEAKGPKREDLLKQIAELEKAQS